MLEEGFRFAQQGETKQAIDCWDAARKSHDGDVAALAALNLGLIYLEIGKGAKSEASFKEAIESGHPCAPNAWLSLGGLYYKIDLRDDARKCWEKCLRIGSPEVRKAAQSNLDLLG